MSVTGVTGSTGTASTTGTSGSTLGKDDFLRLLCTQLEYQNPLDPMDPSEMLSQMSQLSQVEQLTNIADTLQSMKSSADKTNQIEWLSLVGKKASLGGSTLSKGDQVVIVPPGDYDKITLTLKTSDGNAKEVVFNPGDSLAYSYDGELQATVSVSATKAGKATACGFKVYNLIAGVELGNGSATVVLANGDAYSTDKITGIRD